MKTRQLNKLDMYRAVRSLLDSPDAPLTDLPAFPARLAAFDAELDHLITLDTLQASPLAVPIVERDAALDEMVFATITVAGIALSYAAAQHRPELAAAVRIKPSAFDRVRLSYRAVLAQVIFDALAPVAADLAVHGLTPEMFADFQTKIETARAHIANPRCLVAGKKSATTGLVLAFRRIDALLNQQIDPLLFPLQKTHPDFYLRYRISRKIVHRRGPGKGAPTDTENIAPAAAPTPALASTAITLDTATTPPRSEASATIAA